MRFTVTNQALVTAMIFILGTLVLRAETEPETVLGYNTYIEMVRARHPISIQADLQREFADAKLLSARGGFDPVAYSDVSQKYFQSDQYYSLIQGGIEIPTWLGIELNGGYEINEGVYLNPEHSVPDNGQWFAGLSVSLGRGLMIDERRAELRKAELHILRAGNNSRLMINKLLYVAGSAYIAWHRAYNAVRVYEEALSAAESRLSIIRSRAIAGDIPSVDTIEVMIQVQNFAIALREAELEVTRAFADLNVFLWEEGAVPAELSSRFVPDTASVFLSPPNEALVPGNILESVALHPEINNITVDLDQLEIERRLARESLKPKLDLKYNALAGYGQDSPFEQYTISDYRWGLQFSMPLFLRQERGKAKMTDLRIRETELEYSTVLQNYQNAVFKLLSEWNTIQAQVDVYSDVVINYQQLLNSEIELFNAGESSLFLINSRTTAYIQAQLKMIDLTASGQRALLKIDFSLGTLN